MQKLIIIVFVMFFAMQIQAQAKLSELMAAHEFTAADGSKKSLANIIKSHEGKIIYIDFWASWCGPCKKEMPASIKLHDEFKDQEIVFIYLSIDDKESAWMTAMDRLEIKKTGEHWRRGRTESVELLKNFYIYSIPHYMIVGKNGQFVNLDALPPSDPRAARQLQKLLKG